METLIIISIAIALLSLILSAILLLKITKLSRIGSSEKLGELETKLNQSQTELKSGITNLDSNLRQALSYETKIELERLQSVERQLQNAVLSIEKVNETVEKRINETRNVVEENLKYIVTENVKQLDKMRAVVDEKLSETLETRLNQSFELINKSLIAVNQGLGDVQSLAKDVGGLKNVLQNVKVRGTWAEVQLDNLLSEMLTKDQYARTVKVNPNSDEMVDFAIKLPGKVGEVYLPIDAKFPIDDYQRLITASQNGDVGALAVAIKGLETRIINEAKKISFKYVCPPNTTDFAILYLPLEGLYAEVLRIDGLSERVQRDYKVTLCGPNTICALLNSLQMGFKTVAIEKKSAEIYSLLAVFKTQFIKFTELLEKTQKKIYEAGNVVEETAKKTKMISRKLKDVSEGNGNLLDGFDETTTIEGKNE